MNKAIWCYAEGCPGNWEAICLDFDLSVQGESFDEVYRELHEAISMHLEYIETLPKEEQIRFLRRKAPFGLRIKVIMMLILAAIFTNGKDNADRAGFLVHCSA